MFQIESRAQMQALPKAGRSASRTWWSRSRSSVPARSRATPSTRTSKASRPGAGHLPASEPAAHPRGHPGRDPVPGAGDADRDRGVRLHRARGGHLPQGDGLAPQPRRRCRPSAAGSWAAPCAPASPRRTPRSSSRSCSAFAEFGFARAHAAAFAKITYDTAWLKQHYPAYYYAGVLNNQPMGFYSPAVIVGDAKRHGIEVLPVDVNESRWEHERRAAAEAGTHAHAAGDAPGQGDRRAARETPRARARHRSLHVRARLRGAHGAGRAGGRAADQPSARSTGPMRPAASSSGSCARTLADADPARPALGLTDDAQRELGATLPPMTIAERVAADYRELGLSPTSTRWSSSGSGSPSGE